MNNIVQKWIDRLNILKENRAKDWGSAPDAEVYLLDQYIQSTAEAIRDMKELVSPKEGAEDCVVINHDGDKWYWCKCENCGWENSSKYAEGGASIGDTGDNSDVTCPVCGSSNLDGENNHLVDEKFEVVVVKIPLAEFLAPYQKAVQRANRLEAEKYWKPVEKPGSFTQSDLTDLAFNAMDFQWRDCAKQLERKDLGDIERKNYEALSNKLYSVISKRTL